MDRRSTSLRCSLRRLAVFVTLCFTALGTVGCKSVLETCTLLYQGTDTKAEWDGWQKDQKVAVVCRPLTSLEFSSSGMPEALAEAICERLKANVKKIHVIEPQKVADLIDKTGLEDYVAIGKKLKADKVVAVDVESFGVLDGQTLYRGRSSYTVRVFDVATKEVEWHKQPPQTEYPSYGSTPATDVTEPQFRNKFIAILADQIARCFYPHDREADYARDVDSMKL